MLHVILLVLCCILSAVIYAVSTETKGSHEIARIVVVAGIALWLVLEFLYFVADAYLPGKLS